MRQVFSDVQFSIRIARHELSNRTTPHSLQLSIGIALQDDLLLLLCHHLHSLQLPATLKATVSVKALEALVALMDMLGLKALVVTMLLLVSIVALVKILEVMKFVKYMEVV